ncbi:Cytochrome P450 [Rhizoctonia solani]|uniref:Cytochrome P450 n=1 Tax=Rhizoctonia solani TaxID=456999 RepID=A0A8H7LZF8_9AGAM|nr:Cytochrome P450 [Rhizoctonia solani]
MEAATDLLEKRSATYSNRFAPQMIISPIGLDMHDLMTVMNPNDLWRKYRKALHSWLNKQGVVNFSESQELQARLLLQRFLASSRDTRSSDFLSAEFIRTMAATMLDSIYGYGREPADDFVNNAAIFVNRLALALQPSREYCNFLVNFIPWLQYVPEWLPGTSWKKVARDRREHKERTFGGIYKWTKQRVVDEVDDYSIIASTLRETKAWGWDENMVDDFGKQLGMVLYMGGTDTSASALVTFVLAMILFPDTQAKAQQEIDSITGKNRLPTLKDRSGLPYVERLTSEVLRWQPVSPLGSSVYQLSLNQRGEPYSILGVPHVAAREDSYCGNRIPKDTIVFGNLWAMSRDERIYVDPDRFNPDRYLDDAVPVLPAFGWGSRLCPGIHLADSAIFMAIASILATFNISGTTNPDGTKTIPSTEPSSNTLV